VLGHHKMGLKTLEDV